MLERGKELPLLSLSDYEQIEARAVELERKRLITDMDLCGIGGVEKFKTLQAINPYAATFDFLATKEGVARAITASAKKAGMTDDEAKSFAESYDIVDGANLARSLVGMERRVDMNDVRSRSILAEAVKLLGDVLDVKDRPPKADWYLAVESLLGRNPHPNSSSSAS